MKILKFIVIIPILFMHFACSDSSTSNATENIPQDWSLFDQKDYSIHYPNTWTLDKSGEMGTSFVLFSPLDSKNDAFKENINLLIQKFPGQEISLEDYTNLSVEQIKKMLTNAKIIENQQLGSNGKEFSRLVYTGKQGVFDLKFEQYFWVGKEKAYVLTFTTEENEYANYKSIGEKILNSFHIK